MTTLVEIRLPNGQYTRCDAKCYNAEHEECSCICGGQNHGLGFKKAKANTAKYWKSFVECYVQEHQLTDYETVVNTTIIYQLELELRWFSEEKQRRLAKP